MTIHICSFSSGVSYLAKKEKKDAVKVLRALEGDSRVSDFEMGEDSLWKTVQDLERRELVKHTLLGYPWHRYEITVAGVRFLEKSLS